MERINFRKLDDLKVRKHYQITISNMFEALMNLNDSEDINRTWKNIKENINTSTKESLGLYELIDKVYRKQAKIQWLQYPNLRKVDNLNNVRIEASRYFRKK